jgi:hypothetical protein
MPKSFVFIFDIVDADNTARIMDTGRMEDLMQQNVTQMQNLQGEPRTTREQQGQKDTN